MALSTTPAFNIGAKVYTPGMNPTMNLPGGGIMNLGLSGVGPTTSATGNNYAPLGDWRTPLGLTDNWGKISQPLNSWFINPKPYINTLNSIDITHKNLQPVIPLNPVAPKPITYTAPKPFDYNAFISQLNKQYPTSAPLPMTTPKVATPTFNVAKPAAIPTTSKTTVTAAKK